MSTTSEGKTESPDQTKNPDERVGEYFARDAERFDGIYSRKRVGALQHAIDRVFRSDMQDTRRELIEGFVPDGARCLEIGSGSGRIAVSLARNRNARVVGIDLAEPMVDLARALAQKEGVSERCTFQAGDFMELPVGEPFDCVVASGVLDYQADPGALLARAAQHARRLVVSYPHRFALLNLPRRVWLRIAKNCPVYFYSDAQVDALVARIGGRITAREPIGRRAIVSSAVVKIELDG